MSPSNSCLSFEISFTTSPLRTVELLHLGCWRVEDTTYLGRLLSLSAHSPLRHSHRAANRPVCPWGVSIQDGSATRCEKKVMRGVVGGDLMSRARAGDGEAFRQLT